MFMDLEDNIVKMLIFPKWLYKFNAIFMKIPANFFIAIYKLSLKFVWKFKGSK